MDLLTHKGPLPGTRLWLKGALLRHMTQMSISLEEYMSLFNPAASKLALYEKVSQTNSITSQETIDLRFLSLTYYVFELSTNGIVL